MFRDPDQRMRSGSTVNKCIKSGLPKLAVGRVKGEGTDWHQLTWCGRRPWIGPWLTTMSLLTAG